MSESLAPMLTGREELYTLVVGMYSDWHSLARLLSFKLGKSLQQIASPSLGMDKVVFELIEKACQEDWCHELVAAIIKDRPGNREILQWEQTYLSPNGKTLARSEVPSDTLMALHSSFFDLTDLRNAIEAALITKECGLLGLGIAYPDLTFVNKVCEWLPYCIGEVQRKEPINLKPEFAPVTRHIKQVARYRRDLMTTNVVCPILAEGVPLEVVESFWKGVSSELTDLENWLVLIITTYPDNKLPAGTFALPAPKFTALDITVWAREMVRWRNWPPNIAKLWSSHIVEEAQDGPELDVRAVYEAMDRSITEVRTNPEGFRARLERRNFHAHTASR